MTNVLAMILAGGRVDELGVLTFFRPKSVLPFGGLYRVIDCSLSNLMHSGIEKVGILSQYRPFHLIRHIANGEPWDMVGRNRCAAILPPFKGRTESDWYKGTADAVYQNIDFINLQKPDLVMILSGDHVYKMDYRDLIAYHLETSADLTIAFTRVPAEGASRFGLARIDDEDERGGRVLEYIEKPKTPSSEWASLTIYLFKPGLLIEALTQNAQKTSHEFGKDIIPLLVQSSKVYGYKHHGYWGYTRTLDEYWQTSMDLLGPHPKIDINAYRLRTNMAHREIRDRGVAHVGRSAVVEDSLFYSGCDIKGTVVRSILFPGVKIAEDAVVEDSILFFDNTIGPGVRISRTICDVEVHIASKAEIGRPQGGLTVVGRGTSIPSGIKIGAGVTVYPNLVSSSFTKGRYDEGEVIQ
ncbi:MAG: Glucose-1-phosphate adenylyltransferase [Syntrophorhabdus sp. PtaU1.Bin002]|nr:MAG: Glucose-1-phosphate adenylyltransferase [Syntrophorhabdus sp. PtaU1.Bin002]